MYAGFFGFRELPFNNTPDPRFFYPTPDHEEALASLVYAVEERKGFVLLTGEVGTGKTLVSRMMLRHFGTQIAFATINHAVPGVRDLMESICTEFDLPVKPDTSPTQLVRTLHDFLLAEFAQNIPVVLVLDEAQNLLAEGFEQLRMIGNLEADDAKLLQIAIVGQPELQRMFLSSELRQIRQRIFRSFHLPALNHEATEGYIRHRLSVVTDTNINIFSSDAITAIYRFSHGLPRVINTICDNALLSAYSADKQVIDAAFLGSVISQMMIVGGPPEAAEETAKPEARRALRLGVVKPARPVIANGDDSANAADHTRTPNATDMLADRIEQLGRQVEKMENRLRTFSSERGTAQGHETARLRSDVMTLVKGELTKLDNQLRKRVDGFADRLAVLEQAQKSAGGDPLGARAVETTLKPLVREARSVLSRTEDAVQELDRRDKQLRALAVVVRDIIRDLRMLLDRAEDASVKGRRAEQGARAAGNHLAEQSERSRRLADQLMEIVDRLAARENATRPSTARTEQERVTDLPYPILNTSAAVRHVRPDSVQRMLDSARDSLFELRDLARSGGEAPGDRHSQKRKEPAAARLAQQVESLLDMVEPEENVTARQTSPVTA